MTVITFIIVGMLVGIITTAPVGPVNVMVIQKAAHEGFWPGLLVGLGAVAADLFFAGVAVFGISAVAAYVDGQSDMLQIVGGILLIGFGIQVSRLQARPTGRRLSGQGRASETVAAFLLTLTNPGTILGFAAIFGGLGAWGPQHDNTSGKLLLLAGVAMGATGWWAFVAGMVSAHKQRLSEKALHLVNQIAGYLLIGFGVLILGRLAIRFWS